MENVSRKLHFAMESFNVPTVKMKRIATSESREDVRPTLSLVDRVNVYQNMSFAMQSSRVAMGVMNHRTCVDPTSSLPIPSKDQQVLQQLAVTVTVHSSAVTVVAEVLRLFVQDAMVVAMEAMSHIAPCVVSARLRTGNQ